MMPGTGSQAGEAEMPGSGSQAGGAETLLSMLLPLSLSLRSQLTSEAKTSSKFTSLPVSFIFSWRIFQ